MANLKTLARYLVYSYEKLTTSQFENSELKLQKLMYFAQRESLALTGEVIFEEEFEGWIHGPVIPDLRFFFEDSYSPISTVELETVSEKEKYIIHNVLDQYAKYETWTLRNLTHEEFCWKKSREGLGPDESGNEVILLEDIKTDAANVRQYDHVWGMFLDEFADDTGDAYVQ